MSALLLCGVIPKVPWLTRTTLRPFRLFMLSSASAVVLPYPHSRWKVIHLLCLSFIFYLLGPEIYSYDLFELKHFVVIITLHRRTLQLDSECRTWMTLQNWTKIFLFCHRVYILFQCLPPISSVKNLPNFLSLFHID